MAKLWRKPFDLAEKTAGPGQVNISREQCKGCGFCVQFCPRQVLVMGQEINSKGYTFAKTAEEKTCLSCVLCEIICPEFCIQVKPADLKN